MNYEDYLEFAESDSIRIKGHRIFLENILERWLSGYSPEHIVHELPTLTLEEVYASITYYLHNQVDIDAYLARARQLSLEQMRQSDGRQDEVSGRLRAFKQQRQEPVRAFSY